MNTLVWILICCLCFYIGFMFATILFGISISIGRKRDIRK